jgi:hypothetical protein
MATKTVPRTQRTLVNALDRLGRPIEPSVLFVARDIAPKALSYAQKSLAYLWRIDIVASSERNGQCYIGGNRWMGFSVGTP